MKVRAEDIVQRIRAVSARRAVVVYNPRSSKAKKIEREVLEPLKNAFLEKLAIYEVLPTNVDDNAEKLARFVRAGDAVITAGGDGTATIGLNGVMLSEKDVHFTALPYGNFNDMARSLGRAKGSDERLHPVEALVNGKHFRFAACYFTMGLFAESTEIFDGDKMRKKLQTGKKSMAYSVRQLAKWYFENRKKQFVPEYRIVGDGKLRRGISDVMVVNGVSVARMMRGGKWYLNEKDFRWSEKKLTSLPRLIWFMMRSILFRLPGDDVAEVDLDFEKPGKVEIQAEGEYRILRGVEKVVFRKTKKSIKIL